MKKVILICFTALSKFAVAQEDIPEEEEEAVTEIQSTPLVIGQVISEEDTSSIGTIKEIFTTVGDSQSINFVLEWETVGDDWDDGYWVQNYAQWPVEGQPGKYMAMTCNAQYDEDEGYARNVSILNYYGNEQITVSEALAGKWDSYGTQSPAGPQFFVKDNANERETYKSSDDDNPTQKCAASALIWSATGGVADDEDVNTKYWEAKEGASMTIQTGFRVWKSGSSAEAYRQADAAVVEYTLFDFGINQPVSAASDPILPFGFLGSSNAIYFTLSASLILLAPLTL